MGQFEDNLTAAAYVIVASSYKPWYISISADV